MYTNAVTVASFIRTKLETMLMSISKKGRPTNKMEFYKSINKNTGAGMDRTDSTPSEKGQAQKVYTK